MPLLAASTIKDEMRGRWADFIGMFGEMLPVLERKLGVSGPCPIHGGIDGFRLFKDFNETGGAFSQRDGAMSSGVDLTAWLISDGGNTKSLSRDSVGQALKLLSHYIDPDEKMASDEFFKNRPVKAYIVPEKVYDPGKAEKLKKTMKFSKLVKSDENFVIKYLRDTRLLDINSNTISPLLRTHNNILYYEKRTELVSYHPAMIALMSDMSFATPEFPYGKPTTLHRTYLTKDGLKAVVDEPKKTMASGVPSISGSACWLDLPYVYNDAGDAYMAISEGIETALGVKELTGTPTSVASINATLLELVNIPSNVKWVDIYADHDLFKKGERRGERSALVLKKRLEDKGIKVRIIMPPIEGADWLDMLQVVKTAKTDDDKFVALNAVSALPRKEREYAINKFNLLIS